VESFFISAAIGPPRVFINSMARRFPSALPSRARAISSCCVW
jgi:hypothetical protein